MSAAVHNYPTTDNQEFRSGLAPATMPAEALRPAEIQDAQIIPIDAGPGQEAATPPPNPFAELAQFATERALVGRSEARVVRVGKLIGYAFGKGNLADVDRHLYQDALNSTPGTTYLGDGNYQVGPAPIANTEVSGRQPEQQAPEVSATMADLVDLVVRRIKPGPAFPDTLLLGVARSIHGILTRPEIAQFFDAVAASSRLTKTEDGTFILNPEATTDQAGAEPEPPQSDYDIDESYRPFALSDRVVKKHTLEGMMRAALETVPRKKPSHGRKHPGYKRFDDMDNYVPDTED